MKKFTVGLLSLIILLLFPTLVFAQTDDSGTTIREELRSRAEERREMVEQRRLELMQKIEEKKATREARLTEVRQQRIRLFWGRLKRRLLAAMDRLERLIERIESRLTKFEEANPDLDTASIHNELDEAKEMLEVARTECEAADATIDEILESEDPKAAFEEIREAVMTIKMQLIEIHRILVMVIGDIKGLRVGADVLE